MNAVDRGDDDLLQQQFESDYAMARKLLADIESKVGWRFLA
jgi:hypothetical protein